jgi:hypothetical protein
MIHYDVPRLSVFLFCTDEKFLSVFVLLMHFMLLSFFEEFLALEKASNHPKMAQNSLIPNWQLVHYFGSLGSRSRSAYLVTFSNFAKSFRFLDSKTMQGKKFAFL